MIFLKDREYLITFADFLSDQEIHSIEKYVENISFLNAQVFNGFNNNNSPKLEKKEDFRKSSIKWIFFNEDTRWLWVKMTDFIKQANNDFFHFDLEVCNPLQYGVYTSPGGNYGTHMDTVDYSCPQRKISFSIQLTDENNYEGGDLLIYNQNIESPFKASRKKGSITLFFSMFLHEVTPVISGTRHSLVSWVSGPALK